MARRNRRMLTSQFLSCQSGGRNATGRSCDAFCRRARASDYHQQLIAPGVNRSRRLQSCNKPGPNDSCSYEGSTRQEPCSASCSRTPKSAIVKTNAALRLSAAMRPMVDSTIDLSLSSPSLSCVICQQILEIVIRHRPFVPFAVDENRRSS